MVTGSLGLGYWYHERIRQRIQNTETLIRMLDLMMSEIRYGRATLPECCQILKKRMPEPYAGMFERMMFKLQAGDPAGFETVFGQCMEETLQKTPAGREEREVILGFTGTGCLKDRTMQLLGMERCLKNLIVIKEKLESEAAGKEKLAMGLGSLGGLFLLLLLW